MKATSVKPVRCANYTRVSTDQGLDQEFNSLDAQYDASSAYIKSQAHAGWTLIKARYDDGNRARNGNFSTRDQGSKSPWVGDRSGDIYWRSCRQQLLQYGALDGLEVRFWTVVGSGVVGFVALLVFALGLRLGSPSLKVLRGARLQAGGRGLKAFAQACVAECRIHGEGVALVPSIPLGREREARHFLILGSLGGGKTQTMLHLISEAIARKDGVLVLDTKGDMMGGLPALGEPLLVAPHDQRSLVWDVAADCSIKQDARELAARFIPPSSDPMWSQAAQEIFVACIVHLQTTRGRGWSWADLEAVVTADVDRLAASLGYYDHLQHDDYYSRGGEPPGRWARRGAERASDDSAVERQIVKLLAAG